MADQKTGLVVTAHPGDFVWRAGGAVALHAQPGYKMKICLKNRLGKGSTYGRPEDRACCHRAPRRFCLARRRRRRAACQARLQDENRLHVLRRAWRESVRLEGTGRQARESESWTDGRGRARRQAVRG